jgi:hypothetical protein
MSFQNLELTPLMVSELYRDFLVDAGGSGEAAISSGQAAESAVGSGQLAVGSTPAVKFLGGNQKKITFIVSSPSDVFLPDADLNWLGKMLEACKLNLGDVAVVNIARTPVTVTDIKDALHPHTLIMLGTDPQAILLPMNFPPFNVHQFDGMKLLNTPSPSEMNQPTNEAKLLKSKLWVCLQKLFNL